MNLHIRWMIRRDMPEVLNIESRSFDYPWTEQDFLNCLRQRNCIAHVAEYEDQILGFVVYKLSKSKITILNLATHPEFRRRGVASRIIQKMKNKLCQQRRRNLDLHVSDDNLSMQLFLKQMGFLAKHIEPCFYKDHKKDAYYFNYSVVEEQEAAA